MNRCPNSCGFKNKDEDTLEFGDRIFFLAVGDPPKTINATSTISQQLAQQLAESSPKKSFEDLVPQSYQDFRDIFSKESFDQLPLHKSWDHAIELVPEAQPFMTKVYPISPVEQAELDTSLEDNLRSHRICPSKSPMASPVFFIKKKDGSLHLVQDYCKLNDITIKNHSR